MPAGDQTRRTGMVRGFMLGAATAISLAAATPAYAVIELQWWHAMTGGNNDVIVKLANDFNAAQSEYKVVPAYKGSYPDTMNAGIAAFRAGNAPHIMQVFEVGTATMMAATGAVKPVHVMMKEASEKFDSNAYLSGITGYYSTAKGEMLSFPFNSSSTVMWINRDAFKKAGLDPNNIPKTWPEVFDAAKKLKANGHPTCGFSNAWVTWVMGGKKPEEYKGVAKFFTFLSDTDRQVEVHKTSGYLPITKAAYAKTRESGYYKENPYLETPLLELTNKEPTENSRGLRLGNMVQLRDVWAEEIEAALAGKKNAKEALDAAVNRGNAMLRQFERTVTK